MFKFLNLQPEIVGIDVNDLSLKIAKIKKKRSGFYVQSLNRVDIKPGVIKEGVIQDSQAFVQLIRMACSTITGQKLQTRYAAISLPEEKSFSQIIQMPKMSEADLASAVPFEVENYIPLTIDKVYLDFEVVHQDESGQDSHIDISLNAMPKAIVDSYVACFKKAGLIPCILEVESQSIARALLERGDETAPTIVIDIGEASSVLIIFSRHAIRFAAPIPFSGRQLTLAIADHLNISAEKAERLKVKYGISKEGDKKYDLKECVEPHLRNLVDQVKKYVNFYRSHSSHESTGKSEALEKVVLSGGGAYLRDLPEFLSQSLKMPVGLGDPLVHLSPKQKKKRNDLIPAEEILLYTTVIGLALRGAQDTITPFYANK